MFKDPFLRLVAASFGAWLLVAFGVPEVWALSMLDAQATLTVPLFIGTLLSALYAPWWLIDAILLRPILLPRIGWLGLAPIECLSICGYRWFMQRHVIANGVAVPMIVHLVKETLVLYAGYLALSVLLLHLLSRLADRKTSPPAN